MILPVHAILVAVACFFTAIAYRRSGALDYAVAAILWLSTAVGSLVTEIPYIVYSSGENTVVEGVQKFTGGEAVMAWVYILLALVMFFHAFYYMFKKPKV